VGARLFTGEEGDIVDSIRTSTVTPPSRRAKVSLDPELDTIVMKALQKRPDDRYLTAAAMAEALETRELASPTQVGAWVKYLCGDSLERRTARIAAIEREVLVDEAQASSRRPPPPTSVAPPSPVPSAPPPSRASEERRLAPSASRSRRGGLLALVAVALALAVGFGLYRMKRRSHRAVGVTMATAPTSPPTVAIPDISASPPPSAIASTAPPASALASPSASALAPRGASKGARPAPRAPR
jgi:serine/threonine-protein kinase